MENDNKYNYAREIMFTLKSCHAITPKVYMHWLDKIDREEHLLTSHNSDYEKSAPPCIHWKEGRCNKNGIYDSWCDGCKG